MVILAQNGIHCNVCVYLFSFRIEFNMLFSFFSVLPIRSPSISSRRVFNALYCVCATVHHVAVFLWYTPISLYVCICLHHTIIPWQPYRDSAIHLQLSHKYQLKQNVWLKFLQVNEMNKTHEIGNIYTVYPYLYKSTKTNQIDGRYVWVEVNR